MSRSKRIRSDSDRSGGGLPRHDCNRVEVLEHDEAGRRFAGHEAAQQGQLIRYLYGLRLAIPPGWKSRYAPDRA